MKITIVGKCPDDDQVRRELELEDDGTDVILGIGCESIRVSGIEFGRIGVLMAQAGERAARQNLRRATGGY